jgi:hypothetical protein
MAQVYPDIPDAVVYVLPTTRKHALAGPVIIGTGRGLTVITALPEGVNKPFTSLAVIKV